MTPMRICAYAHCRSGFGHLARTQRIAAAVAAYPDVDCTVITCQKGATHLAAAPGVRVVALPDTLRPEHPASSQVLKQRAQVLAQAYRDIVPDVLLVDHMLFGINAELLPIFRADADRRSGARFVLGMPYGPYGSTLGKHNGWGIRRHARRYDASFSYACAAEADPWLAYRQQGFLLPDEHYRVGVVREHLDLAPPPSAGVPLVAALAGSGFSGASLFRLLLSALRLPLQRGQVRLRLVAGPMLREAVPEAAELPGIEYLPQASLAQALAGAAAVVSRVGYNTAHALMATSLPLVLCPFRSATGDQVDRAALLAGQARVWVVDERHGVDAMAAGLSAALASGWAPRPDQFGAGGEQRAAQLLVAMAERRVRP